MTSSPEVPGGQGYASFLGRGAHVARPPTSSPAAPFLPDTTAGDVRCHKRAQIQASPRLVDQAGGRTQERSEESRETPGPLISFKIPKKEINKENRNNPQGTQMTFLIWETAHVILQDLAISPDALRRLSFCGCAHRSIYPARRETLRLRRESGDRVLLTAFWFLPPVAPAVSEPGLSDL